MPSSPPRACERCGRPTTAGWFCEACKPKESSAPKRNEKFYQTRAWRNTSSSLRNYNPICQRITENGRQCHHASTVVHHIFDPTTKPAAALDWNNLVALCATCHPGGQPGDRDTQEYVHTYGAYGSVYYHARHADWHDKAEQQPRPQNATAPTGKVGNPELDKALQGIEAVLALKLPGA